MSLNESPASNDKNIEELKAELDTFISQNSITQFESEDIIELIEEGESLDWIIGQMKNNSPDMNTVALLPLLESIQQLVGQSQEPDHETAEPALGKAPEEPAIGADMPDLSQLNPSSLDLTQLADSLPPGMQLPPGVDMNQIKDMLESPQGKAMSDFLLFCSEKGIDLNEGSLEDPRTQELQSEWKSTPREAFEGKTPDEMMGGDQGGFVPEKVETFRHEEPRIGRNDPCPCGSGKKYKKCCG